MTTFVASHNYSLDSYERHIELVEYLKQLLEPSGFFLKRGGYGNYTYTVSEYDGGPSQEYDSCTALENYEDYGYPDNIYSISEIQFVNPPNPVDVEFDYTLCDGEITACINTKKIPTSKHRTGKIYWNECVGKFEKSWKDRETFELEFEDWFQREGLRLLNIEKDSK